MLLFNSPLTFTFTCALVIPPPNKGIFTPLLLVAVIVPLYAGLVALIVFFNSPLTFIFTFADVCVGVWWWWIDLTYSDYGLASYPYMSNIQYDSMSCIVHVNATESNSRHAVPDLPLDHCLGRMVAPQASDYIA